MSSNQQLREETRIPGDYANPPPAVSSNFEAPAHHLSQEQRSQIVEIAESGHHDTGSGYSGGQQYGSGSGSGGFGSRGAENIASTLGGGSGSATHSHTGQSGQYERTEGDLTGARTNISGGSGMGVSQVPISGTGQNSGIRTSNDERGLGSSGYDNNQYDNSNSRSGHSGAGLGAGAGAAAAGGAVAAKHQEGRGGELTDHEFRNTAPSGTLEHKLQDELERNARKSGTHATGFGAHGGATGTSFANTGSNAGMGSGGNVGSGYTSGTHSGAGVVGSGVGTGAGYGTSGSGAGYGTGATAVGTGVGAGAAGYAAGNRTGDTYGGVNRTGDTYSQGQQGLHSGEGVYHSQTVGNTHVGRTGDSYGTATHPDHMAKFGEMDQNVSGFQRGNEHTHNVGHIGRN